MAKRLELIVHDCTECPYIHEEHEDYCTRLNDHLEDVYVIPDNCPLEDE